MSPLTLAVLLLLAQAPAVSVSFDLRALSDDDYRRWDGLGMERKVALRLIQEGFAVVSPDSAAAQLRLRVVRVPDGLMLEAEGPDEHLRQVVPLETGTLAELHLEVAQRAAQLFRSLEPAPEEARASPPRIAETAAVETAPPLGDEGLALAAGAGAAWRGTEVDPVILLSVRHGLGSALGLDAEVGMAPSRAGELSAFELQAGAFLSHRFRPGTDLHLEPGLGAGVLVHFFQLADRWASAPEGSRVSPAGWLRLRAGWALTEALALEARVAVGAVTPLRHQSEGVSLWAREGWRAEAGASVWWSP